MAVMRFTPIAGIALSFVATLGSSCSPAPQTPGEIVLFAAASSGEAVKAIAATFEKVTGHHVVINTASTATLAGQVKEGATADLFLSADQTWMDELEKAGRLRDGTRRDLLANDLVLVGAIGAATVGLAKGEVPATVAAADRIALADPATVPAGRYARESFTWLGWWEAVESKMVTGADVRATLKLVEMGEAPIGVVYATDARSSEKVRVLGTFPAESHTPIVYPVALLAGAGDGSAEFLAYLSGDEARRAFESAGFRLVGEP